MIQQYMDNNGTTISTNGKWNTNCFVRYAAAAATADSAAAGAARLAGYVCPALCSSHTYGQCRSMQPRHVVRCVHEASVCVRVVRPHYTLGPIVSPLRRPQTFVGI